MGDEIKLSGNVPELIKHYKLSLECVCVCVRAHVC